MDKLKLDFDIPYLPPDDATALAFCATWTPELFEGAQFVGSLGCEQLLKPMLYPESPCCWSQPEPPGEKDAFCRTRPSIAKAQESC